MAAYLEGERVRVLLPGWHGVWKIRRLWNTNTEGFAADLERVDKPDPEERFKSKRGTALTRDLQREE